jgi:hypothetical protein
MWQDLVLNSDYEICTVFPYPLRKKDEDNIVEEQYIEESKEFFVNIDGKFISKPKIVALQFVEKANDNLVVSFKNRDKKDYRISNLAWVPKSQPRGPTKAEYLEALPEEAIKIESFNDIEFNDYCFDPETKRIIQTNATKTGDKIKVIKPTVSNNRNIIVIKDIEGKRRTIDYNKLIASL